MRLFNISQILAVFILLSFNLYAEEAFNWGTAGDKNASIYLQRALKNFRKKKDVVIAVIDTGIDPTHPFIKNNIYVPNSSRSLTHFGFDFSKGATSQTRPFDEHGHGTHISGIIKNIYKDVKILSLKYYNPRATGEENLASTILALKFAIDNNVDIINYSGGGPEASQEEYQLLIKAKEKGILVVAASGNEEANIDLKNSSYYPASYGLDNIITVTAHDINLNILPSSNYGKLSVDVSAPGDKIRSSLPFGRMGNLTGTSQATAFVSGVAALIKSEHPEFNALTIKQIIKSSSILHQKLKGKCANGAINAGKALALAKSLSTNHKRNLASSEFHLEGKKLSSGKIIYRFNSAP